MSSKLALIARRMNLQSPEKAPAPADDDLSAAIQRLVDQRIEAAQQQPSPHVQRLLDQQFKPKTTYTDFAQIPSTPRPKTPPNFEAVVSQRDQFGRIAKMISKPINGEGPTFEIQVTQRDENGNIHRVVSSLVDDPSTMRV